MRTKLATPVAAAVGFALLGTTAVVQADALFALKDLGTGYRVTDSNSEGGHDHHDMSRIDTDGDGAITQSEWNAAGKPADKWAQLDGNADGRIDASEWAAHHKDGEGKCGEGKCGEGKCGEGKCGGSA